jgi:soluble lytic murein transglycosylase-like protein
MTRSRAFFFGLLLAVPCSMGSVGILGTARTAAADIYSFEDKDGVVHFTNLTPPKSSGWKRLARFGPGRAATVSGSSIAGCKASRADVVPARDRSPDRYTRYDALIVEASRLYAIPEALLRAVIKVESDYDPHVVSCAGARGLMQIMPDEEVTQRIDNVFDPRQNILAGARLLRLNANRYRGDLVRTIAAYHAGVGAVEKYGGVPPYQTTQQYVQLVTRAFTKYRSHEGAAPPRG